MHKLKSWTTFLRNTKYKSCRFLIRHWELPSATHNNYDGRPEGDLSLIGDWVALRGWRPDPLLIPNINHLMSRTKILLLLVTSRKCKQFTVASYSHPDEVTRDFTVHQNEYRTHLPRLTISYWITGGREATQFEKNSFQWLFKVHI